MPRISVIVPVYDVEAYVGEALDSIAAQSFDDFEVVMVDDGSNDRSPEIAAEHAERDGRFRLVCQPNQGLGAARNTGVEEARGELLSFVDSDDKLPPDALGTLVASLDRTGSDLASGHVLRFDGESTWPAAFLARTFARSRRRTHVTRFRWLLSDRMAQNKLWRRAFWDRHGLRFPVGRLHEDIPVVLPAHLKASHVDVLRDPVYLYRERPGSITQGRTRMRTLLDRLAAVEHVHAHLGEHGPPRARRWYEEVVVEEDLRYHLDVLPQAGADYRATFLHRVNAFLDKAGPAPEARLPAIQRLKWHLVRRRLLPELLDVVAFEQEHGRQAPKVRVGRHVYGAYPYFRDARLGIPDAVYRLDTARRRARHLATLLG